MKIIKKLDELTNHFKTCDGQPRCLADTGFLYALAYDDDRLHNQANDLLDKLSDHGAALFVNVISRLEFVDLIFRKQVTNGCIQLFSEIQREEAFGKPIYNLLKDIRDKDTAARRNNQSYKIEEHRLKKLRKNIEQLGGINDWKNFCNQYVGCLLVNEWETLEDDLGLSFIEIMEGDVSNPFHSPLKWKDMIQLMGEQGLRGPDAMIVNLFVNSKLSVLITTDRDFESCISISSAPSVPQVIFVLD